MRRAVLASALVTACEVMSVSGLAIAGELEGFVHSYSQAQSRARRLGKPMYLHFTTAWCGWCRRIEREVYASKAGKAALDDFVPASLDCTLPQGQRPTGKVRDNIELMSRLGGRGYPFLAVLTPEGELIHAWSGYLPVSQFIVTLGKAHRLFERYSEFLEYAAEADKERYEYNLRALKMYARLTRWRDARPAAEKLRRLDPQNRKGDGALAAYVQLKVAQADQATPPEIKQRLDALARLDPDNGLGWLERGCWSAALAAYRSAGQESVPARRRQQLYLAAEVLQRLTTLKGLSDGQGPYGLLAAVYTMMERPGDALAALETGIAVDPDSETGRRMAQMKKQLIARTGGSSGSSSR